MKPTFSIIIPTYNRPDQLRECLKSLTRLQYPKDSFEVIVIDDGSALPIKNTTDLFSEDLTLINLRQDNQGPAAARNHGAEHASNDFIAFTDDDCQPDPQWLSRFARQLSATPDHIVGGLTVNALTDNIFSEASQMIIDIVYRHYNADLKNATFFANNNFAVASALFRQVGGMKAELRTSEDREFCDRWRFLGYQMTYVPQAIIQHHHALSLKGFCLQHFQYGRGAYRFHRLRAERGSGQLQTEVNFNRNWRNWLLAPFRRASGVQAIHLTALLILWRIADVIGYCRESLGPKS